jgi:hypothetical protein
MDKRKSTEATIQAALFLTDGMQHLEDMYRMSSMRRT